MCFRAADFVTVQVSLEAGRRTRETVVASGYFPGDETRITELVVRLMKFCEIKALPLHFRA